jgi:hypothetical protein
VSVKLAHFVSVALWGSTPWSSELTEQKLLKLAPYEVFPGL